jgi:hypothetical protein
MTLRSITDFKGQLIGGGSRPNLFSVALTFPTTIGSQAITDSVNAGSKLEFLAKSAALPASNITPIEVPFRGRVLKVAGERTFDTWSITVINDVDFKIRTAFEEWMNGINDLNQATGETRPAEYDCDLQVSQLNRAGEAIRTYDFIGCFPTNISQIDLSMDTTDTIEEYSVEFQILYWRASATTASSPVPITSPAIST